MAGETEAERNESEAVLETPNESEAGAKKKKGLKKHGKSGKKTRQSDQDTEQEGLKDRCNDAPTPGVVAGACLERKGDAEMDSSNAPNGATDEDTASHQMQTCQSTASTVEACDTPRSQKKTLHDMFVDPLVSATTKTKEAVQVVAKPVKQVVKLGEQAAVKVRDDVELLVRDPKEFAKQKKCEVEDLMFPEVEDEDDDDRKAFIAKQRTVHLKDYTFWQFSVVVARSAWLNLSGGFVNAIALGGIWRLGMTHLTGTTTFVATRAISPPNPAAAGAASLGCGWFLAMMACFGLGGLVGGAIIGDNRYRWRGRQALTLSVEVCALVLCYLCLTASLHRYCGADGHCNVLEDVDLKFAASLLVSLGSGAHTTSTTLYTGLTIRSCHVTGTVTDIGLAIGQMIHCRSLKYLWKLQVWVPCLGGFLLGAGLGMAAYNVYGYESLLIAAGLVSVIIVATVLDMGYKALRQEDRQVLGLTIKSKTRQKRAAAGSSAASDSSGSQTVT